MANILFKQGSYTAFKDLTAHEAGALYFTTDEGGLYLGTGTGANDYIRVQGSVQYFATLSTFNDSVVEKPPYAADVIYFVADKDALIRYDAVNKKWVQLNITAATFAALESTVAGHSVSIGAINTSIIDLNSAVSELQELVGISSGEGEAESLGDRIAALENWKANDYVTDYNNLSNRIGTAKDGDTAASGVYAYVDNQIKGVNGSINSISGAIVSLNETVGDSTKGLVKKVNDLEGTINDSTNGLNSKVSIADFNDYKITAKGYVDGIAGDINGKISTINGNIDSINAALINKVEADEFNQYKEDAKEYVDEQIISVNSYIDGKINAANGLVFKATITSWSQLPTSGVSVGDTYVIGDATITAGGTTYYAGDLLIASGNEENGIITSGLTWEHVKTGYTDMYEAKLTGADNKIKLTSYTEKSLGEIEVVSNNDNIKVSVKDNKITVGMEWGTF